MSETVQEAICAVVWDLFPSIAPYVPAAPQPEWPPAPRISDTPEAAPKKKKPPFDPSALRCCYVTRSGTIVYRARRFGSTRDVAFYWPVERVLKKRGLYLELAVRKARELPFREELRALYYLYDYATTTGRRDDSFT
jgi:hypothetical protein